MRGCVCDEFIDMNEDDVSYKILAHMASSIPQNKLLLLNQITYTGCLLIWRDYLNNM